MGPGIPRPTSERIGNPMLPPVHRQFSGKHLFSRHAGMLGLAEIQGKAQDQKLVDNRHESCTKGEKST